MMFKTKKDRDLERTILERIRWDKRVSNADVKIEVKDGKATLTGVVDSITKKKVFLDIVSGIKELSLVTHYIAVTFNMDRNDKELETLIHKQMGKIPLLAEEKIRTHVRDGVVHLSGKVFDGTKKAMAAGYAWELSGVRDCMNNVKIVSAGESSRQLLRLRRFTDTTRAYEGGAMAL